MQVALLISVLLVLVKFAPADVTKMFPQKIADGIMEGNVTEYDPDTIFAYMDGAAEVYLRFDFKRLYTAVYNVVGTKVEVEVYEMGSSPEAFGVFSTDLEGEKLTVAQGGVYLHGVLRCWQDRFFIKIAALEEKPETKEFAIAIGHHFAEKIGRQGALPDLVLALPKELLKGKVHYFHTHDDLNSIHYVSTENVLNLEKQMTDVALIDCSFKGETVKAAVIRYRTASARDRGWERFCQVILSKKAATSPDGARFEEISKGKFIGIRKFQTASGQPMLALCFEAKSAQTCLKVMKAIVGGVQKAFGKRGERTKP